MRLIKPLRSIGIVPLLIMAGLLALVVTSQAYAHVETPSADIIHSCVKKSGEVHLLLDNGKKKADKCKKKDIQLNWNAQGIQGDPGQPGQQGIQGDPGQPGQQGVQGDPGQPGQQGVQGDPGQPGQQGVQGDPGQPGGQGVQGDPGQPGGQGVQGDPGLHTVDTDTQLNAAGVQALGFTAGPHIPDTNTQLDAAGVTALGFTAGPHTPAGSTLWTDGFDKVTTLVNVGIGTTSPAEKLEVSGNIRLSSAGGGTRSLSLPQTTTGNNGNLLLQAGGVTAAHGLAFQGGNLILRAGDLNTAGVFWAGSGAVEIHAGKNQWGPVTNGDVKIFAGNTDQERMRIVGDSGRVLIGTSTSPGAINGRLIVAGGGHVFNASQDFGFCTVAWSGSGLGTCMDPEGPNDDLRFIAGGAERVRISGTNGNTTFTGKVYALEHNTTSDSRLKTNVAGISDALDKVLDLRGVSFDWAKEAKVSSNLPQGSQIGFLAQEVEQVIPEVVNEAPDGYKSVAYGSLTSVLVEAIKEQQQQIKALEARLA